MNAQSSVRSLKNGTPWTLGANERSCGRNKSIFARRSSWLLIAAGALVGAGFVLGSSALSASAALPLLYLLPCLVMMGMCMKGHGKGGAAKDSNSQ